MESVRDYVKSEEKLRKTKSTEEMARSLRRLGKIHTAKYSSLKNLQVYLGSGSQNLQKYMLVKEYETSARHKLSIHGGTATVRSLCSVRQCSIQMIIPLVIVCDTNCIIRNDFKLCMCMQVFTVQLVDKGLARVEAPGIEQLQQTYGEWRCRFFWQLCVVHL